MQVIYNIFEQEPQAEFFPAAKENDVGVIVRVAFEGNDIGRGQFQGKVKLGMAGRVEIVTDQQSLLSILMKKVRQSISLG